MVKNRGERVAVLVEHNRWAWLKATEVVYGQLLGETNWDPGLVTDLVISAAEALVEEREPGRPKMSCGLNDDAMRGVRAAMVAIEADSYARLQLWAEYQKRDYKLEQMQLAGGMETVGAIKIDGEALPVNIEVHFFEYMGEVVMTYEACSRAVDYNMIEKWVDQHVEYKTDAMNAHNALMHIEEKQRR